MSIQRFCEQCGKPLPEGARFCESCGTAVAGESAPSPSRMQTLVPLEPEVQSVPPASTPSAPAVTGSPDGSMGKLVAGLLVIVVGAAGWWLGRSRNGTPAPGAVPVSEVSDSIVNLPPPTKPAVAPTVASVTGGRLELIDSGDFTHSIPMGIEGDGGRWDGPNRGNWSWRFVGPDDMAISIPLKPTSGSGGLTVSFQLAIPEGTLLDPAIGGIRVRTRLMDRYESSAVADVKLQPAAEWQLVSQTFGDTASGPYTLWIEVLGFTGAVYLDQLVVIMGEGSSAPPPGAPGLPEQESHVPVETWFAKQPWMQELSRGLPAGVTLEVFSAEMEGDAEKYVVELRENHAPGSGFDPGEAPRWGVFQVSKDLTGVYYLSPETNRPEPVEVFLEESRQRLATLTGGGRVAIEGAGETELERWVGGQAWFQKLEAQMPKGVTLSILKRDDGFEGWTTFEIREHHSPESGFDPDVVPLVGLFEVSPRRDEVGWFDPVTAEWGRIEDFITSRGLR